MNDTNITVEPESLNCMVTKQYIGLYEYTVLYDGVGNKYLKLEKDNFLDSVSPEMTLSDFDHENK